MAIFIAMGMVHLSRAVLRDASNAQKTYIEVYGVPCTHNKDLGYHACEDEEMENNIDFVTSPRLGSFNAFDKDTTFIIHLMTVGESTSPKYSLLQLQFLGSHDLKGGVSSDILIWDSVFGYMGNLYYVDLNASLTTQIPIRTTIGLRLQVL